MRKGPGKGPRDPSGLAVTLDRLRSVEADARQSARKIRSLGDAPGAAEVAFEDLMRIAGWLRSIRTELQALQGLRQPREQEPAFSDARFWRLLRLIYRHEPARFERELGLLPRRSLRLVRQPEGR